MPSVLIHYSYLQLLDLLTTIAFLVQGVQEGNPLVRFAIHLTPSPIAGLMMVKIAALMLGVYCWRAEKTRLLGRVNIMFAALIAWNLVALILGSVFPGSLA
ncbi:MAG: DUF5658 family protein [Bryobacteraceae bacterium]